MMQFQAEVLDLRQRLELRLGREGNARSCFLELGEDGKSVLLFFECFFEHPFQGFGRGLLFGGVCGRNGVLLRSEEVRGRSEWQRSDGGQCWSVWRFFFFLVCVREGFEEFGLVLLECCARQRVVSDQLSSCCARESESWGSKFDDSGDGGCVSVDECVCVFALA